MNSLEKAVLALEVGFPSTTDFLGALYQCKLQRDGALATRLHSCLLKYGLESHTSLGNHLVSTLAEVGCLHDAHLVFEKLAYRYPWSWNSLIMGYIKCGNVDQAFILYQRMKENCSLHPTEHVFSALLKSCGTDADMKKIVVMHAEAARRGVVDSVGCLLIEAYAKCGMVSKAQEVFDKLAIPNADLWNALMDAYNRHGLTENVVECFGQMQFEGVHPTVETYILALKACGSAAAGQMGQQLHAEIERKGFLGKNVFIGSSLVDMYAKCGFLLKAQEVFNRLTFRNVVTWTALIAGFTLHGYAKEALMIYDQMQADGIFPNVVTFICVLKACGSIGALDEGQDIHSQIKRQGLLEKDLVVGNALIDMYAKCGSLLKAQKVFERLPVRNVVSWTALIAGYVDHGHGEEALMCFMKMQHKGVSPNPPTFVCAMRACGTLGALGVGQQIHAEIERRRLTNMFLALGNSLIDMYAKCGKLSMAKEVFEKLQVRDVISWNSLLAGYAEHDHGKDVLMFYEKMQHEGVTPDAVTFNCGLKACGCIGIIEKGIEIHAEIERKGLLGINSFIGSTLVDMYAKCGLLTRALEIFHRLPVQELTTWNALIAGYAHYGLGEEALDLYGQMQEEGVTPDAITFLASLKACGAVKEKVKGEKMHDEVSKRGLFRKDLVLGSTLVDMYAKCGWLTKAQHVFDNLLVRDVILWNALMRGYAESEHGEEALKVFEQMQLEGISPDASTYMCSLKVCSSLGATSRGQKIHTEIARKWPLGTHIGIDNTLIDMYAKCGSLFVAHEMLHRLPVRDVVSWNSLIAGYSQQGDSVNVFHIFDEMLGDGVKPDLVSFAIILHACSIMGLLSLSQTYFEVMSQNFGIIPTIDHHTSMVDIFGRIGDLDMAIAMIKKSSVSDNIAIWRRVLEACKNWGNVELGKRTFDHAVHLRKRNAALYHESSMVSFTVEPLRDVKMRSTDETWFKSYQFAMREDCDMNERSNQICSNNRFPPIHHSL